VSQLTSRKALSDEPVLDATNLNARFTDFASATTSINPANLRDGAVDLPQYAAATDCPPRRCLHRDLGLQ
jgi:hypothetical protein